MAEYSPIHRYLGTQVFSLASQSLFFGRNKEISAIIDNLQKNSTLTLWAKSGQGKSSLIQAGLLPSFEAANYFLIPVRLS